MDATTINRIAEFAIAAEGANQIDACIRARIIGGKLESLESLQAGRARFRGKFATPILSEYVAYLKANVGGQCFIDAKQCRATTFLNLGDKIEPGHCDWTAALTLEPTAAYAALRAIEGKQQDQRMTVEWIEDWAENLQAQFGANAEPSGITRAVDSIRRLTIAAKKEVTHTDKDFGASRSALEDIEAKADAGIPSHLVFTASPYPGFQPRDFKLRLSVITGDKPAIVLRTVSKEAVEEDIAREFKQRLLEEVGDAATLIIGGFTP